MKDLYKKFEIFQELSNTVNITGNKIFLSYNDCLILKQRLEDSLLKKEYQFYIALSKRVGGIYEIFI